MALEQKSMPDMIEELLVRYDEWELEKDGQQTNAKTGETSEVPEKPRFEVTDKSQAEWVMRKIAKLQGEQEEVHNISEEQMKPLREELDQIYNWEQTEKQKLQRNADFLKSLLEPYHRKILEVDPKAKTIKLPHGEMKIRSQQPEIKRDDDKLLYWLDINDMRQFIKTKETPDWAELKKDCVFKDGKAIIADTGQVVDGVVSVDRPDKFEVIPK